MTIKQASLALVYALATVTPGIAVADDPQPDAPKVEDPKPAPAPAPRVVEPTPAPPMTPVVHGGGYGWDTPYAVLFSLNNVLQVNSVLSEFQGLGIAFQKHRSPTSVIRAGARLQRTAAPQQVTKTTTSTGTDSVSTFTVTPGTSLWDVLGSVDLLRRFTEKKISPYMGAGVFLGYNRNARYLDDELSVTDQLHTINERDINVVAGARGIFGITWRIHSSFAIFAEYALTVPVVQWRNFSSTDTLTDTSTNASAEITVETKTTQWFNFDVGLVQGASFGLAALF
jgi:hypothetical protein